MKTQNVAFFTYLCNLPYSPAEIERGFLSIYAPGADQAKANEFLRAEISHFKTRVPARLNKVALAASLSKQPELFAGLAVRQVLAGRAPADALNWTSRKVDKFFL